MSRRLLKSEKQYRLLIENLPQKVFFKNRDLVYELCNKSFAADFNMKPEEVVGKTDYDLFPTYLAEKYRADDRRVIESGHTESIEESYVVIESFLKEAKEIYVNTVKTPFYRADGQPLGVLGFFWDITERKKSEEEVRSLKQQMEFVLGATKTGIDIIDSDFNMVYIDPEWQKVYGDFSGVKCYKYFMDRDDICPGCGIVKALETKQPVVSEETLAKEGNRCIEVTSMPFQDKSGKWMVAEVNVDITERLKAERELKDSEGRFRAIFDYAIDGIVLVDPQTRRFIIGNRSVCRMLGYTTDEFSKLSVGDIHPEESLSYVYEAFESLRSGKTNSVTDIPVKTKDGKVLHVDITATVIEILGKKHMIGMFHDITAIRSANLEREKNLALLQNVNDLRQSLLAPNALEDKLKNITDSIVRIFAADFCRIWIIRPGDMCGKGCIHAEILEGPHVCRYRDKCLHLVASSGRYTHLDGKGHGRVPFDCYKIGRIASGEDRRFLTNDVTNDPRVHDQKWARDLGLVSFAGYQVSIPKGDRFGVLALFAKHHIGPNEDVILDSLSTTTAFVIQESLLIDEVIRVKTREAGLEAKSKFTSMISHELRSPLAVIKESVDLVLEGTAGVVGDEQKHLLEIAKNNTERLNRLINSVLDFQKIVSGKLLLNIKENHINEILSEACASMGLLMKEKNLALKLDLDNNIPRTMFDRDMVIQVIGNLLGNAIKFTKKGFIGVGSRLEADSVHITVEDTGTGIKDEDIRKVFEPFERLDYTSDKKSFGSGLGLPISKEIVLAHKGKIWAESKYGAGSTFHFTIPLR